MQREYDLFERLPGGLPLWCGHVSGLDELRIKLREIAESTTNGCFAVHLSTMEVVGLANVEGTPDLVDYRSTTPGVVES